MEKLKGQNETRKQTLIERVVEVNLPTRYGNFRAIGYRSVLDSEHHLALVMGKVEGTENVLVRVHSECLTGDVFHSLRCDCGEQLEVSMKKIARERTGVLLYIIGHEGRGIGLMNKLIAYKLQEEGRDTVEANLLLGYPADLRNYSIAARILVDLGLSTIRLMTNNPKKIIGLERYGLKVVERVPIEVEPSAENFRYLKTKRDKMFHLLGSRFHSY
jgi:3,4-dihydroxy 2-butanone 4-phosphate synthase/GTP cyclohydrolase II